MSSKTNKKINPLISEKSIELLQFRLYREEMSVRLYYAMSIWLDSEGYINASKLWKHYSDEEDEHINKVNEYLLSVNVKPEIRSLEKPKNDYASLDEVVEYTYSFMLEISDELKKLATHALKENDHMLYGLAQWFLAEQIPAYKEYSEHLMFLSSTGKDKIALRLLDNAMGEQLEKLKL
jgi:ferritin